MTRWILKAHLPPEREVTLFVFPYAGGGAAAFAGWHDALAPGIGVATIQTPGRENRLGEEPLTSYAQMLPAIIEAVTSIASPRLAFFGHSAGAHLAFAVAQRMRIEGLRAPEHMLISGRRPVHLPADGPVLSALDDDELTQTLMRRSGQTALPSAELFEMMLPTTRADIRASESWSIEDDTPLKARLSLLTGTADGWTQDEDMLRWRDLIEGETRHQRFPGDHFFLHAAEAQVLDFVREELLG